MDATRYRRVKSAVHQQWYAGWRLVRFASHLGFLEVAPVAVAAGIQADEPKGGQAGNPSTEDQLPTCHTLAKEIRCWRSRTGGNALN